MQTPLISVVVPVLIRNDKQLAMTMKCLGLAKLKTKLPYELIIVESGSQYLADEADVHIYEKDVTTPEISHNRGFRAARGEYVVLLTNDVFVDDNWLECLLDCFKLPWVGAATLASTQFHHVKQDKIEEGNWWSVAMVPKKVFEEVGYYDERFINSWCDTDLLIRIYKTGKKMYRNFNCVVEHLVGATIYEKPGFKENYEMGRKLFHMKHSDCGLEIFDKVK